MAVTVDKTGLVDLAGFNASLSYSSTRKIVTDTGGRIHLVPALNGFGNRIYYSDDQGVNWTLSAGSYDIPYPTIVLLPNGNPAIVAGERVSPYGFYVFEWDRVNKVWLTARRLFTGTTYWGEGDVLIDGDYMHITTTTSAWSGQYRKVRISDWTILLTEALSPTAGVVYYPSLTVDLNGDVHVVYYDTVGTYYRKRTSSGWGNLETIITPAYNLPDIIVDSQGIIHIVGYKQVAGTYQVYHIYRPQAESGTAWTTEVLTSGTGDKTWATIQADKGDNLHVFYAYNSQVWYTNKAWNGSSWKTPLKVSPDAGSTERPATGYARNLVSGLMPNVLPIGYANIGYSLTGQAKLRYLSIVDSDIVSGAPPPGAADATVEQMII